MHVSRLMHSRRPYACVHIHTCYTHICICIRTHTRTPTHAHTHSQACHTCLMSFTPTQVAQGSCNNVCQQNIDYLKNDLNTNLQYYPTPPAPKSKYNFPTLSDQDYSSRGFWSDYGYLIIATGVFVFLMLVGVSVVLLRVSRGNSRRVTGEGSPLLAMHRA